MPTYVACKTKEDDVEYKEIKLYEHLNEHGAVLFLNNYFANGKKFTLRETNGATPTDYVLHEYAIGREIRQWWLYEWSGS
jgi:hypothetical protein